MGGSETTVACDDHYQVFRLLQPNYVMGGVGCKACAAGARYATFPRWVLRAPTVKLWGVTTRSKVRSYANCPHVYFALYPQWSSTDHKLHTKPENGL